jgi:eukaryotic-like serine/threonine-protein kinase
MAGNEDATATDPATPTVPSDPAGEPQREIGRYRIERLLGTGGMGVVYCAFDPELERRVALKVLPGSRRSHAAVRERLLHEARAMARLNHPNVIKVYEVGTAGDHDYVAMELVEGANLAEWLRAEPRSPRAIVGAFLDAGRGLVAAHAVGLIHRDFKPHNVLRASDGGVAVTDFGLARDVGEVTPAPAERNTPSPLGGLTVTGAILGTPAYMAPEQWEGQPVGPAADQFAFCVALWEALTGARPFRGEVHEMRAAVLRGPAALDATAIPRPLRDVLRRGLEPEPARRWPDMTVLLRRL